MPKVWIITGSSGGGRTTAEAALATGDKVMPPSANRRACKIWCTGTEAESVPCNTIRNASAAATAAQIAVDAFDRLDVVVNATRSADAAVEDFSVERLPRSYRGQSLRFRFLDQCHVADSAPAKVRAHHRDFPRKAVPFPLWASPVIKYQRMQSKTSRSTSPKK
jgi:NAD(P)-dependent dehydrogenase (short-subunit alcohol dehydrogenase family)